MCRGVSTNVRKSNVSKHKCKINKWYPWMDINGLSLRQFGPNKWYPWMDINGLSLKQFGPNKWYPWMDINGLSLRQFGPNIIMVYTMFGFSLNDYCSLESHFSFRMICHFSPFELYFYILLNFHIYYLYYNFKVCVCLSVCLSVCAGFIWKQLLVMT